MNVYVRDDMNIIKTPIDDDGKIVALTSTYLASLSAAALTNFPAPSIALVMDGTPHTGSGTAETTATTYTLPGETLSANGMALVGRAWFKTAAGGSTRTIKLWWNGASLITFPTAVVSGHYGIEFVIMRSGAASQTARVQGAISLTTPGLNTSTPSSSTTRHETVWDTLAATLSGDVILKTTVQDSAAGANITQLGFHVTLVKTS